jgi:hypothetical protein
MTQNTSGGDKKKKKNQIGLTRHDSVGWATAVAAHVHTCSKGVVHARESVSHLWATSNSLMNDPQWRTGNKASIDRPRHSGQILACDLGKSCGDGRHLEKVEWSGVEWVGCGVRGEVVGGELKMFGFFC